MLENPQSLKMKGASDGGGTTGGEVVQNLGESSDMSIDSLQRDNEEEEKRPF